MPTETEELPPETTAPKPGRPAKDAGVRAVIFDSIAQASACSGIPAAAFQKAKRAGCPAFRSSRVYFFEFTAWLFAQGEWKLETVDEVELDIAKIKRENEQIDLAAKKREMFHVATVRDLLEKILGHTRDVLSSWPSRLAPLCNPGDPVLAAGAILRAVGSLNASQTSQIETLLPRRPAPALPEPELPFPEKPKLPAKPA